MLRDLDAATFPPPSANDRIILKRRNDEEFPRDCLLIVYRFLDAGRHVGQNFSTHARCVVIFRKFEENVAEKEEEGTAATPTTLRHKYEEIVYVRDGN